MTPDELAKMIPPEVVEAAAMAAWNEDRRQAAINRRPGAGRMPSWDSLGALRQTHHMNQARAAIAAALNAWPGMRMMVDIDTGDDAAIKLPLPQETHND